MNLDALATWLDGTDLPGKGAPIESRFVTGGAQNEIYEIRRGDLHAALRIPPASAPANRDEGILREWRIIRALDGTEVPSTAAYAVCADQDVLGRAFYLMGFVDGWSPMATRGKWPAPFDTDPDARRGLAIELVDGIALLSKVDWRARGLEGLGKPDGFHERQVARWTALFEKIRGRDLPGFDAAAAWLRAHHPLDYVPGLLHGDYQFANVMFRHGAPARLAAIVDWEMGTIGDPKLDLAWLVDRWPADPSTDAGGPSYVDLHGMPGRDELIARYAEVSGRQVDDLDYYLILSRFKMSIVLEQGFQRAGDNTTLQAFGGIALDLMDRAASLAASTRYAS
ncbi:phosphotransferase family protein [Cryptosporangium phraense]|uniref:Phosphotransferase family protein n=1 Tax=Cryptosporangium phraense TaxID=2593070 RepID=A0A545B091_9ACTN|nr:phosphotransferase family protein [Cryptosporangium phraense]TQS46992.1 phosphotransferase family protein [Cryptosporangium phraense]